MLYLVMHRSTIGQDQSVVELKLWEEAKGVIESVSEGGESLRLVLITRPILLRLRIPRERVVGKVPDVGSHIGLLRTDTGFRITLIQDGQRMPS